MPNMLTFPGSREGGNRLAFLCKLRFTTLRICVALEFAQPW